MIFNTARLVLIATLAGLSVTALGVDAPSDTSTPTCTEPAVVQGVDTNGQRYALSAITCEP